MNDIPNLLDNLKSAINKALWTSEEVTDSIAMLADAAGEVHISVDVVLPQGTDLHGRHFDASDEFPKPRSLHPVKN